MFICKNISFKKEEKSISYISQHELPLQTENKYTKVNQTKSDPKQMHCYKCYIVTSGIVTSGNY